MANKRRYKGFDYEARNPAPAQPEPPIEEPVLTTDSQSEPSVEQEDAEANEVRLQE